MAGIWISVICMALHSTTPGWGSKAHNPSPPTLMQMKFWGHSPPPEVHGVFQPLIKAMQSESLEHMSNMQRALWHFQSSTVVPVVTQSAAAEQASWHILDLGPSSLLQAAVADNANSNANFFMYDLLRLFQRCQGAQPGLAGDEFHCLVLAGFLSLQAFLGDGQALVLAQAVAILFGRQAFAGAVGPVLGLVVFLFSVGPAPAEAAAVGLALAGPGVGLPEQILGPLALVRGAVGGEETAGA
jgi:hypothetical protein